MSNARARTMRSVRPAPGPPTRVNQGGRSCDFGQGFRFSPPLPDGQVLGWIAAYAGRPG